MSFDYRLIVLTHGDSATLEATLDSFHARVTPGPVDGFMLADGCGVPEVQWPWRVGCTDEQIGFCAATRAAWKEAAKPGVDFVFHLEHDFQFLRDVHLLDLAAVLAERPNLAQMALMRDAVNETEKAAGGLFESRLGEYVAHGMGWDREPEWLEHGSYLTTNPSLMRRGFIAANPWPDDTDQCEGKFGIALKQRGFYFGAWGSGEPWVSHVGIRTGSGY